ncbi:MAG: hypothetical protein IMZ71_04780 [Chloroflexi bacterium]|nr:hypothetical protein [Chloroflexota bacterium]
MKRRVSVEGIIVAVLPGIWNRRLRVEVNIRRGDGGNAECYDFVKIPGHTVDAILPVSILIGNARETSVTLLETLKPILSRMLEGRMAKIVFSKAFPCGLAILESWSGVRFKEE